MTDTHKVYLAGPIGGLNWTEATDWRNRLTTKLPHTIKALTPLRHKEYLKDKGEISDVYNDTVMSNQKAITTRDRWDCQRADAVVFNFLGAKKASIGSCIELGWADSARVPIIVIMEPGEIHDHAMVREVAGWIVPTVDDALYVLNCLFI